MRVHASAAISFPPPSFCSSAGSSPVSSAIASSSSSSPSSASFSARWRPAPSGARATPPTWSLPPSSAAIAGSLLLLAAYFVGVALVGAALGALVANLIWTQIEGDPHPFVVVLFSVAGALLATWLQRYVIILGTAFGGAWTIIVGALAVMGDKTAINAAAAGDIWVAYPMNPAPGQPWVPYAWIVLGLIGTLVQMFVTGGQSGRVVKPNKKKPAA